MVLGVGFDHDTEGEGSDRSYRLPATFWGSEEKNPAAGFYHAVVEKDGYGFKLSFKVKNVGKVNASVVPQVYIACVNPTLPRHAKELKGFDKLCLAPGAEQLVSISLGSEAFGQYSIPEHDWVVDQGNYKILVGDSSADIRLEAEVTL